MVRQFVRSITRVTIAVAFSLLAFLGSAAWSASAQAAPIATPEAAEYQVKHADEVEAFQREAQSEAAEANRVDQEPLGQKIKDKLNLNEPVPEDTKRFFRQVKGEEPIERE